MDKRNRPVKLTALISNRAVSLIGLLYIRAVNLTDLEHFTHSYLTRQLTWSFEVRMIFKVLEDSFPRATMLALRLDCSTAALTTP